MIVLTAAAFLGFLTVLLGAPYARKYLLSSGIYGVDQQKEGKPKVATSGGLLVLFGFIVSVTFYIGYLQLVGGSSINLELVLAALSSVNIIALIGLMDDIHIREGEEIERSDTPTEKLWQRFTGGLGENVKDEGSKYIERAGLGQMSKMLFVLPAALPLIAVGAGSWTMSFPLIGVVHWGILYPLVLLPVGLLFVSNVVNMLAGTNGLSAAMSLVASAALGVYALSLGRTEAAIISFGLAAPLLAFMRYNFYPASLLPGDSLTYLSGAVLFSAMVVGNMEKFGVVIFTPYIIEFFLKLRSGFKAHSWGILQEDGTLKPQHEKTYSLTHPLMRRGLTEKQVTIGLTMLEAAVCIAALAAFTV
ncbi:MAG: hypothetical protein ABEJ98_00205 [Candidatus Nanohaloarchaea archaeon]